MLAGIANRSSARRLLLVLACTLSDESLPLLVDALLWSIQLSALAPTVTVVTAQLAAGGVAVAVGVDVGVGVAAPAVGVGVAAPTVGVGVAAAAEAKVITSSGMLSPFS